MTEKAYDKFHLEAWANRYPVEKWVDAFNRAEDGLQDDELRPILDELYALFPQPGRPTHKERLVRVRRNGKIGPHEHTPWTMCFYIDVGDPPQPIVIEREPVEIKNGDVVLMHPNARHAVEASTSSRIRYSLVLRWKHYPNGVPE